MPRVDPKGVRAFKLVRRAETRYGVQLRKLANYVADIIRGFPIGSREQLAGVEKALRDYSRIVEPWAQASANRMLAEVAQRDTQAWEQLSQQMGRALSKEIRYAPTGAVLAQLQQEQVQLITSLPLQAAEQVQQKAVESLSTGMRFEDLVREVQALGPVTRNRATLIARTEVGRASTNLMQARAQYVGSEGYIWRTVGDMDVRDSHQRMEGKFVRWDDPPEVEPGHRYHAGCFPNCRCWPEPVIPDELD